MIGNIVITVLTGPHRSKKYVFCHPTECTLGRSSDCYVRLAGFERDKKISRHHCLLQISPPVVWVEDLNSRNGTFINGKRIGEQSSRPQDTLCGPEYKRRPLSNGDVLTVGDTSMRVDIQDEDDTDNSRRRKTEVYV